MTDGITYEEFIKALNVAMITALHDAELQHEILKGKNRTLLESITDDIPYPWYTK